MKIKVEKDVTIPGKKRPPDACCIFLFFIGVVCVGGHVADTTSTCSKTSRIFLNLQLLARVPGRMIIYQVPVRYPMEETFQDSLYRSDQRCS